MALDSNAFTASIVLAAADGDNEVMGVVYKGFTAVTVYDGQDNTGVVLLAGGAGPLTLLSNVPIRAEKGVYVEATGSGSGSVLM